MDSQVTRVYSMRTSNTPPTQLMYLLFVLFVLGDYGQFIQRGLGGPPDGTWCRDLESLKFFLPGCNRINQYFLTSSSRGPFLSAFSTLGVSSFSGARYSSLMRPWVTCWRTRSESARVCGRAESTHQELSVEDMHQNWVLEKSIRKVT